LREKVLINSYLTPAVERQSCLASIVPDTLGEGVVVIEGQSFPARSLGPSGSANRPHWYCFVMLVTSDILHSHGHQRWAFPEWH
jgi:hypothetical protein